MNRIQNRKLENRHLHSVWSFHNKLKMNIIYKQPGVGEMEYACGVLSLLLSLPCGWSTDNKQHLIKDNGLNMISRCVELYTNILVAV